MWPRFLMLLIPLLAHDAAREAKAQAGLASPMVNTAIYREGQVRRSSAHFADWTLVCDEIIALKQRFCSLRAKPSSNPYVAALSIDVSTGDNGRPAALLHLPLAVSVAFGVEVAVDSRSNAGLWRKSRTPIKVEAARVAIDTCDEQECLAAWSLPASSIQALNASAGLHFTFCATQTDPLEFAVDLRRQSCRVKTLGFVSGLGFRDAIEASMR